MPNIEKVAIKIHPRAFSAFGADLVTNDTVAITELVKNSYDAFALEVEVSFGVEENGEEYILIKDDGCGMTREVIETAWATIATPYKKNKPTIKRVINEEERTRIVSGNKGLGRFSAARLGSIMNMISKNADEPALQAEFDWDELYNESRIDDCFMTIQELSHNPFDQNDNKTGTMIKIKSLKSIWTDEKIEQLKEDLSRLLSPFDEVDDFEIKIKTVDKPEPIKIEPAAFIHNPKYSIKGQVSKDGEISWNYTYNDQINSRNNLGKIKWEKRGDPDQLNLFANDDGLYHCGPFSFELRAWDLDKTSTEQIANTFSIGKRDIRRTISKYKGISVYRDNVLVLPKSETSRDWLGLDAKRISDLGRRMSTSQIIGLVKITVKDNPEIKDTTDREKLVDNNEYQQFVQILTDIIDKLQTERQKDHTDNKETTFSDLISPLSSKHLLERASVAAYKGENAQTIVKYIEEYDQTNEKNLSELNNRLVYYAQTASLGSISIVILHEFLTGMNSIKRFLYRCKDYLNQFDERTAEYYEDANIGHQRITEVANSFAPLYRQTLKNQKHLCNLTEAVEKSIRLIKSKKISKDVDFQFYPDKDYMIEMYEGELQTIFLNLFDNACYWLNEERTNDKTIQIAAVPLQDGKLKITVSDNGPGIPEDEAEKIFNPGITSKPRGIGMGLVIITELLSYYDGKIATSIPGELDGATFFFNIPMKEGK